MGYLILLGFIATWAGWAYYAKTKSYSGVIAHGGGFLISTVVVGTLAGIILTATEPAPVQAAQKPVTKSTVIPKEIVYNSSWDGSVRQVKDWMDTNFNDPKSIEFIEWSKVFKTDKGIYYVRCKYRAKNGYGALMLEEKIFYLDKDGNYLYQQDYTPS